MQQPDCAAIELATRLAWPCLEHFTDGQWEQRFARGYSNRANSIQCLDPMDNQHIAERLDAMIARAAARDAKAVFRVTPLTAPEIEVELTARGWQGFGHSLVLDMALDAPAQPAPEALYLDARSDEWLDAQAWLQSYSDETRQTLSDIIGQMEMPVTGIVLRAPDGAPVAAALAAVAGDYGVFLNVVTASGYRRQGWGRKLMQSALHWTARHGAKRAAIQVLASNEPAVRLYGSLGFSISHLYHYTRPMEPVA